jgi:outer membrane protein insertion porin family
VASVALKTGYIPQENESPFFERFYLGGRSFRGFDFRGIGPVGDRNDTGEPGDDHVGGDFQFFAGLEVQRPVWQEILAVVAFIDSGTISDDVSLDEYRVSIGTGVRIFLPQLGQAPLAFDVAYPLVKEDTDDTQYFSFSLDLPF